MIIIRKEYYFNNLNKDAMSQKDANKKHYFQAIVGDEVEEMLELIDKEALEIRIWAEGKSDKELEEYECLNYDAPSQCLVLKSKAGLLAKLSKSKNIDNDVFMKIGSGKYQYFTHGILKYDEEGKQFFFPLKGQIFKSQQRINYRLNSNQFNTIQIKIVEDVYDGLDISAGGSSFIIKEEEVEKFPKGHDFEDVILRFNRVNFEIPTLRIAGIWEQKDMEEKPTGEFKVGAQFMNLSENQEEALFKHINGEARAEEMRKKMMNQIKKK